MFPVSLIGRAVVAALTALAANTPLLQAETPQATFHHAYYLEHAQGDFAAAAKLYAEAAASAGADAELQERAESRLAACREEVACADFANLMPPNPLAYAELNRPGERLRKLIDQLGLLAEADGPPAAGEFRVAISPAVIDAVLGIRGMAAAVTGFDMMTQQPSGVAVFHPGSVELVRGLIETALPVGCKPVEAIAGYPTYAIKGFYVTLTARLVIAGSNRAEIEGVIDRLRSPQEESLATNAELAELLKERDGALLFFCINPKPLMPLLNGMMAAGAAQNRELALAQALLDIQSLRSVSGRFDVSDQGVQLEVALRLDEGHRNLIYNFLRGPAIDRETLRCVPSGAAGFVAIALNEAPQSYGDRPAPAGERPIVTALDLGREIFANINGIAVYGLPPTKTVAPAGDPIPDITAVVTVNDPAKSEALWSQMLGIGSLASGGAVTMEGIVGEVEGVPVRSYRFDDHVTIHFATMGHDLFIASTEAALTRSIQARRSGDSILDDAAFAKSMSRLGPHTTIAMMAHPGRCAEIAKPFMSPNEVKEMEPVTALLTDTVASFVLDHSDQVLRLSAAVTGVPDIGPFVSRMIAHEWQREEEHRQLARAIRENNWDQALQLLDAQMAETPTDSKLLRSKFDVLAIHRGDRVAAVAYADEMFEHMRDDARALNNFAWGLLTEEKYEHQYNDVALRLSRRSNELTKHQNWAYVDTLALAEFETGNAQKAVELEEEAIKLSRRSGVRNIAGLEEALTRFQAATREQ